MKQNPFSLYDFLGYVIPGALALMLIGFFHELNTISSISEGYKDALNFLGKVKPGGSLSLLEETAIFIILAYIVGHIVAYLSSLTIEKFSNWVYGYPSQFLLEAVPAGHYWRVGQCSAGDCDFIWPNTWGQCLDLFWRLIIGLFLWPLSVCTFLFSKLFHVKDFFVKPLDENLTQAIVDKRIKLGNMLGVRDMTSGDYHRVVYHYEYEQQEKHHYKMDNYVALYGFLRAMCFIANCMTLWITCKFVFPTIRCGAAADWALVRVWIACILTTYIFFMAFMKFYRRFTLESFMCLIVDTTITTQTAFNPSLEPQEESES